MSGMQYARRMRSTAPKLKQHKKWPENRSQMHLPSPATRNKDMIPASSPQQNGTIRRRAKRNCRQIANTIQIANKNSARVPSAIGYITDKNGREHVGDPVTNEKLVRHLLCDTKQQKLITSVTCY